VVLAEYLKPILLPQQVLLPHVPTPDQLLLPATAIPELDRYEPPHLYLLVPLSPGEILSVPLIQMLEPRLLLP
jgi:hypothetical protein